MGARDRTAKPEMPATSSDSERPSHCLNCGATLHGPYCHACGQPVKGMVRHLRFILHDVLDTVFEYDSRIWRSLIPLYFRPGRITVDFLQGKRIRFVLPFRLFFVMTVVAFLVVQLLVEPQEALTPGVVINVQRAESAAEVETLRAEALARLSAAERSLEEQGLDVSDIERLTAQREVLDRVAARRLEWLEEAEAARAAGREPPPADMSGLVFNGQRWDVQSNPLIIDWLPDAANDQINEWIARAEANLQRAADDPDWLLDSFLGMLPAALFVLMPVFALLLKIFYVGKRWLYTAHLVVALHSHSFLAMATMIAVVLDSLEEAASGIVWVASPLGLFTTAAELWIPVYLLLMQRRVYDQGWLATLVKFAVIGAIYLVLIGFTALAVAAIALVMA